MIVICPYCKQGNVAFNDDNIIVCENCKETIHVVDSTVIFNEVEPKNVSEDDD